MQMRPHDGANPTRRNALIVRAVTAAIALGLVLVVLLESRAMHGTNILGGAKWVVLGAAVCVAALGFAPLRLNQNALIVLTSVGVSLVIVDFALRATPRWRFEAMYQPDDRVLYRLIPGAERVYEYTGGVEIRYKINSQGFRGAELAPLGKGPRVLVYGDSFIQGDFARTEDTFTEQLRGRLTRIGRSVEVVNAGVEGYGPDQELRRMEDELPVLKPDLVIVALYAGNDYGDLLRDKLYKLSSDDSLQDNPLVILDDVLEREMKRARSEPTLIKVMGVARHRLFGFPGADYRTSREARRARVEIDLKMARDEYHQYVIEGDNAVHNLVDDRYSADVSLTPTSASARYRITMMEQIVRRIGETAAKDNVPLVFMLIPSPIDATDGHNIGEVDSTKYPEYKRSTLTDILDQICRRNGLLAVNLFEPFLERRADGLYLGGFDEHWNARGEAYAAELMVEFLRAQNLLSIPSSGARIDQTVRVQQ